MKKVLLPIISGLLIDIIDFATFGPLGLYGGFVLGAAATYFLCMLQRVPQRQSIYLAIAAGLYCMTPLTEFIPLGTALGAYLAWRSASE
ncbi:MAG: hypothetical protein H6695_17625 [Deferribacteres bacterium]|nr:hypothetical protein [candidate division KSB1 bacterium]MCB9512002.1 hypothetical protein [Deferribacteres bacterium]